MYLCGPNTIVYDTLNILANPNACRVAFISASCTLVTSSAPCVTYEVYFVKNNGKLVITPDYSSWGLAIIAEPGAIIDDQSSSQGTTTYSCASILFPSVNCSANGIEKSEWKKDNFGIFPNPATNQINIIGSWPSEVIRVTIYDLQGRELYRNNEKATNNTISLQLDLASGLYIISIGNQDRRLYSAKLILTR